MGRFQSSSDSESNLKWISTYWNRRELKLIKLQTPESDDTSEKSSKKKKEKKSQEELEQEEERNRELLELELNKEEVGFPVWIRDRSDEIVRFEEYSQIFPEREEILESLGLGKNGPPVPPPAEFSVVPYPAQRVPPNTNAEPFQYFSLVATGPDDPNLHEEEKAHETPQDTPTPIEARVSNYPFQPISIKNET